MNKKIYLKIPKKKILNLIKEKKFIGNKINFKILNYLGIFIIKKAFSDKIIFNYKEKYFENLRAKKIKKTRYHLTQVKISDTNALTKIIKENKFKDIVKNFYNGNVGCDFIRIVKKDLKNSGYLFLHQDTGYLVGGVDRYSLFIALTKCNYDNGGIIVYPGTHKFGYLGDVGEISKSLTKKFPKIQSNLEPGDVLVMHSSTWHESPENKVLKDRIYLEVHIQNAVEPNTKFLICGKKNLTEWKLAGEKELIFSNSRVKKIKKLYKEISLLKNKKK
jgi:hypothetical protein